MGALRAEARGALELPSTGRGVDSRSLAALAAREVLSAVLARGAACPSPNHRRYSGRNCPLAGRNLSGRKTAGSASTGHAGAGADRREQRDNRRGPCEEGNCPEPTSTSLPEL